MDIIIGYKKNKNDYMAIIVLIYTAGRGITVDRSSG